MGSYDKGGWGRGHTTEAGTLVCQIGVFGSLFPQLLIILYLFFHFFTIALHDKNDFSWFFLRLVFYQFIFFCQRFLNKNSEKKVNKYFFFFFFSCFFPCSLYLSKKSKESWRKPAANTNVVPKQRLCGSTLAVTGAAGVAGWGGGRER